MKTNTYNGLISLYAAIAWIREYRFTFSSNKDKFTSQYMNHFTKSWYSNRSFDTKTFTGPVYFGPELTTAEGRDVATVTLLSRSISLKNRF